MKLIANFELFGKDYSVPFDTDEVESATDNEHGNDYYVPISETEKVCVVIIKRKDGSLVIDCSCIDYYTRDDGYSEELNFVDCKLTLG